MEEQLIMDVYDGIEKEENNAENDIEHQVDDLFMKVEKLEQRVNEIEQFYLNSNKMQPSTSQKSSFVKDKDKAVDHPYLVVYSKCDVARRNENKSSDEQFCSICHDVAENPVVTSCEHLFCKSCVIGFSASYGELACPSCSKPLTVDFSANNNDQEVQKPKSSYKGFKSSSIINRIQLLLLNY